MGNTRSTLRFLVVDDELLIGAAFGRVLHPCHVERCTSAEDAIRTLEKHTHFDGLISDLMLPGLSGVELYTWVAANRPALAPHVLFMTGSPHALLARRARALSPHPLLVKPFNLAEVRRAVIEASGKSAWP